MTRTLIAGMIVGVVFSAPPIGFPLHTYGLWLYTPFWLPLVGCVSAIVAAHRGFASELLPLALGAAFTSVWILWWVLRGASGSALGPTLLGAWVVAWISILLSPLIVPLARRFRGGWKRAA